MVSFRLGAALLAVCFTLAGASAQTAGVTPPAGPPATVSGPEMSILIRSTMIALHQANTTGNYTVLRDLGASVLQASETAADLAAQFADFRAKQIGLGPTVLFDPVLDRKPELSTDGQLRLVGHFPTKPQEVVFDLTYLYQAGAWRIAAINVGTRIAADTAAGATAAGAPAAPDDLAPPATAPAKRQKPPQ